MAVEHADVIGRVLGPESDERLPVDVEGDDPARLQLFVVSERVPTTEEGGGLAVDLPLVQRVTASREGLHRVGWHDGSFGIAVEVASLTPPAGQCCGRANRY